jgi:hypothetical protein
VQLFEADEGALARNVGKYLWEGLRRGDGVLIVVTPEHQDLFSRHLDQLGAHLPTLLTSRQLVLVDAQQTLAQFMVGGQPDWLRFEKAIRATMRLVRPCERAGNCVPPAKWSVFSGRRGNSRQRSVWSNFGTDS